MQTNSHSSKNESERDNLLFYSKTLYCEHNHTFAKNVQTYIQNIMNRHHCDTELNFTIVTQALTDGWTSDACGMCNQKHFSRFEVVLWLVEFHRISAGCVCRILLPVFNCLISSTQPLAGPASIIKSSSCGAQNYTYMASFESLDP